MSETNKKIGSVGRLDKLAALADQTNNATAGVVKIPLDKIMFDPTQPRMAFHAADGLVAQTDEEALQNLANSLAANGQLHAITVQEMPDGRYLVRVGERRTRAAKLIGWTHIDAVVRNDLTGMKALALQMAENTDRQDLTANEIAQTVMRFITKSDENPVPMTYREVADYLKKSPSWVQRYVTFANQMLQEKWVQPGYVNSPEILYLISCLPDEWQDQLYADVSTERIKSPVTNAVVRKYRDNAHRQKEAQEVQAQQMAAGSEAAKSGVPVATVAPIEPGSPQQVDAIAAALESADPSSGVVSGLVDASGVAGAPGEGELVAGASSFEDGRDNGYTLDPRQAQEFRVAAAASDGAHDVGPTALQTRARISTAHVVPMRVSGALLQRLIAKLGDDVPELRQIEMEVRLSAASATRMVEALTGQVVNESAVATMLADALRALRDQPA